MIQRFAPFLDVRDLEPRDLLGEVTAALALTLLAVPQGVAYALIAGLPPAMGLYAAAIPTIVGSVFRSSRHVVSGPTNAISLLVGGAVASASGDPMAAAVTIALTVGVLQALAGAFQLGAIVDYISGAVVLGYITGAATLIAVGQLGNITNTSMARGHVAERMLSWGSGVGDAHMLSVAVALLTIVGVVGLQRVAPKVPGIVVAMGVGIASSWWWDFGAMGMKLVRDLSPVPAGLPPLTLPDLSMVDELLAASLAVMLLSLVESSAVARNIAGRTGQRLDTSVDFFGQGLANVAAALTGGYAVSGSLSRSALNERSGAVSRVSGALSGVFMLVVLLFLGPVVDWTPIPVLAGILMVVAWRLVDRPAIRDTLSSRGDGAAFLVTLAGTWVLSLDRAILLGVGISIAIFLRRVRHLIVVELAVDQKGDLHEVHQGSESVRSPAIKLLHVEGNLFFGAASELQNAMDAATRGDPSRVFVVRLKRTQGIDLTTASVLRTVDTALQAQGRHLLLVGMRPRTMELLRATGIAAHLGDEDLFPTESAWFGAMDKALERAVELAEAEHDDPIRVYLRGRRTRGLRIDA